MVDEGKEMTYPGMDGWIDERSESNEILRGSDHILRV